MNTIRHAAVSDPGRKHKENQDRWFADSTHGFWFVCDGMANDLAPRVVVETLPPLLREVLPVFDSLAVPELHEQLQWVLGRVNKTVFHHIAEAGLPGLGTTLVLAILKGGQALLAHLGDSRIYQYRDTELTQLTEDHSVARSWIEKGFMTEEDATAARANFGPTRFLGQSRGLEAELQVLPLEKGDRLLLCSDGLTEMLSDRDMLILLEPLNELEEMCQALVAAANKAGGKDNITAVMVGVE